MVEKLFERVIRSTTEIQGKEKAPQSKKVITLDYDHNPIIDATQLFEWTPEKHFA